MGITTKIMLALVIVSGVAGIVLGFAYVPSKYMAKNEAVKNDRDDKVKKANKDVETEKSKLEQSKSELATIKSELATANIEKAKVQSDNDILKERLTVLTKQASANIQIANEAVNQRDDAQKQLAGYKKTAEEYQALGFSVDEIKKQLDELKKFKDGINPDPPVITGTIRNVDPKYGFVTIDIGAAKGVKAAGIMSVTRNGKFVGQIKVRIVQPSLSIADAVKGTTKEELKEGDVVTATKL